MKDISIYFQHVTDDSQYDEYQVGSVARIHSEDNFPTIDNDGIALIFCPESRRGNCSNARDYFRASFYSLYKGSAWDHTIYDLGTIVPGEDIKDTIHALSTTVSELVKNNIVPIVIGGSQDLTMGLYNAYGALEQLVNLTTIDHRLDIGDSEKFIEQDGWLTHILLQKPCYLFNYSNIGVQGHYNSPKTFKLFEELYFDVIRLGEIKGDLRLAEPIMRNTDILSFDLQSIAASAWQSTYFNSPNGIDAYEACGLMRYAGISDKLTCLGLFNQESTTTDKSTNELIAQLIWYFCEGYAQRKGDFPVGSKKKYKKYRVHLDELNEEIVFCKSDKSSRWWMEVPYPSRSNNKFMRHQLVPCTYEVYQEAMKGEIPDLWWRTYQKIS